MDNDELLTFPTDYSLKVFGKNNDEFELAVLTIVREHFKDIAETAISTRESRDKTYMSITIDLYVEKREQIDGLYIALNDHQAVLMTL